MTTTSPKLPRRTLRLGAIELAGRDPVLGALVELTGLPRFRRPVDSPFAALVRAILYQQLAGAAAAAIHRRLVEAIGDPDDPAALLRLSAVKLRAVGLSSNKAASLRDLAEKVLDGTVDLDPRRLSRTDDEKLVAHLSSVRGVGRWTAQMFLMFQLRRIDVWPSGDFGVRRGYGLAWKVPTPTQKEIEPLGDAFRPYRSVAAWYCWRAAEIYGGAEKSAVTA